MKNAVLVILKKSEGYISGQELGDELGVSRAAIWKAIKNLQKEGYIIEAVTNKGYKLFESGDLLNAADVQAELTTTIIGKEIKVVECVDSTNNYLRTLAFDGCEEGTVVIAHTQTGGKGRRGKNWVSPKGEGLWMSVLIKPKIGPNEASRITLVTGLSVCQGLRSLGYDASIKWPNDIIIKNKKVCGILAEMNAQIGYVDFVVIGIGVNVNTERMPEEIKDVAISLRMVDGTNIKRSTVAAHILNCFEDNYNKYLKEGFQSLIGVYEENCINLNREVQIIGKDNFNGQAVGISSDGELIVMKENGERVTVYSGDVSIRGVM